MDLGAADPTYILPGMITLSFLAVTEIGMVRPSLPPSLPPFLFLFLC